MRRDDTWPILSVLAGCRPERTEIAIVFASNATFIPPIPLRISREERSWRRLQALSADEGLPKGLPSRKSYRGPQDGASSVLQRREEM